MANTNFAALMENELIIHSREFWQETRNNSFFMAFAGNTENSMIQRVTELTDRRGTGNKATITLVNDGVGDGTVGDDTLKGNEEALRSTEVSIQFDQWRHAHKNYGRMSDQKSVVQFRRVAKTNLSRTCARVMDETLALTMAGVSYEFNNDGTLRTGSKLPQLEFAADVTAPTSRRHFRWNKAAGVLAAADTTAVAATDLPTWNLLVDMKAKAVNEYMNPLRSEDGVEVYNVFMTPNGIAALKKDPDFLAAMREAQQRGEKNPLFKGTRHGGKSGIYVDGLNILEYRNVFHSSTWGSGANVHGQRVMLCGAQAIGMADIGNAYWNEEEEDYGNIMAVAIGKMFGWRKSRFFSTHSNSTEDFSILCVDTAENV